MRRCSISSGVFGRNLYPFIVMGVAGYFLHEFWETRRGGRVTRCLACILEPSMVYIRWWWFGFKLAHFQEYIVMVFAMPFWCCDVLNGERNNGTSLYPVSARLHESWLHKPCATVRQAGKDPSGRALSRTPPCMWCATLCKGVFPSCARWRASRTRSQPIMNSPLDQINVFHVVDRCGSQIGNGPDFR